MRVVNPDTGNPLLAIFGSHLGDNPERHRLTVKVLMKTMELKLFRREKVEEGGLEGFVKTAGPRTECQVDHLHCRSQKVKETPANQRSFKTTKTNEGILL